MACRKLPYYQRFLHRENFFSPLKVVYRKQLKGEKRCTNKYQWDLIHDPKAELFSWLEDEEEAEMISISDLLTQIRSANQQEKPSIEILKDQCPQVCYKDYTLEGEKLKYLQVNCTKEFENAPIDENMTAQLVNYKLAYGEKMLVMPGEKSNVFAESISGGVVYYQFHEAKVGQAPIAAEITDNFLFEFAVLKEDKDKFEEYLYPKPEYSVNVTWISQFNTIFEECTGCWENSCCRRACEYMLGFTNCANCSDKSIAKNSPVVVKGNIRLSEFTNDSNWETDYDNKTLSSTNDFQRGVQYIKNEIRKNKHAVVVGLHFTDRGTKPYGNVNKATYHYMVIVAYGEDDNGTYFKLFDPGRNEVNKTEATNIKLYIEDSFIVGDYKSKDYTITEIVIYY